MADDAYTPLEEAAWAATPGPWEASDTQDACCGRHCTPNGCHESHDSGVSYVYTGDDEYGDNALSDGCEYARIKTRDAHYIAAAHPQAVLELIEKARERDRLREAVEGALGRLEGSPPAGYGALEDVEQMLRAALAPREEPTDA